MSEYTYTCLFEPSEDGGFVVTCPALPGLVSEGDTLEEARAMVAEATEGYLEILQPLENRAAGNSNIIRDGTNQ